MDPAVTLNEYGQFLWRRGEFGAALVQFERLLTVAYARKCPALRSAAWNNLAVIHRELGETAFAAACQQQSWDAASSQLAAAPRHEMLGSDLTNLANTAILSGDYGLAERLLEAALECDVMEGDSSDEAADWGSLGIVAALNGEMDEARKRFVKAYRIHRRLEDDRGVGCDLGHLAELFVASEEWRRARRLMARAIVHFDRAGCRLLASRARQTLLEIGRRERATGCDPARN
ncbi:MAG TPA: tetratricopeptide repeat protein [Planctomycetaceae bacterium]|nr:tetratricopeptide repeat protein [Planctomycetaceae bacterium]